MKANFGMWRKALWELVKMEQRSEWDGLDVISKWLIATRSAVTTVTVYSSVIAGLLAWRDGFFSFWPWLVVTLGLFIAHGTNNLLNDYTDFSRGVDKENYFRTQYGVHPLVQGFWTKSQQLQWFFISGLLAFLSGVFALFYTQANPLILALFAFGALTLLFYTWPMKYLALGELAIFLIWGPILITGVYLVLAFGAESALPADWWKVAVAGVPFGLSVASINVAKHTDKLDDDKKKGVGTFPVRVGQTFARYTTIAALILAYGVVFYLTAIGYFSTFLLLIVFALPRAVMAVGALLKPRPNGPPAGAEAFWPAWFSGFAFYHNRMFGGLFITAILLDVLFRVAPFSLPLGINFWGLMAVVAGGGIALARMRRPA